jgi:deoxyribonuclease-4
MARSPIGAHVFVGGGLVAKGLRYADEIGAEAVQVFVSNPRGWAPSPGDAAVDEAFRHGCLERQLPVFIHAPYLVNLVSPTPVTRERSVAAVRHSLSRGQRIGAAGVVMHAGSAIDARHRSGALHLLRELLLPILDDLSDGDPSVLIEPMAGGGAPVAAQIEDLPRLLEALDWHPRLAICLDTCHAYAAGHDVASPEGMRTWLRQAVAGVGADRIKLIHANDSKDPLGSGRDRHTNIGTGYLGTEPFAALLRYPATRGTPVVVETPGDIDLHRRELQLLKTLRDPKFTT